MPLFRKLAGPRELAVSMVGVKLGDRLLQVGCGDGRLLAALAAKVGLTGRACAVDVSREGVERAERAARKEGVLLDVAHAPFDRLPHDDAAFDVVVLQDVLATLGAADRTRGLGETRRVLRPGGRCVVIERTGRHGVTALFARPEPIDEQYRTGGAAAALAAAQFVAARTLADREGLRFVEAIRPRA